LAVRKYELIVILDPVRTEEQQKETLDKIDEVVTKYGGTPDRRDVWGKRRLAYQINRRRDGYYSVVYFDAPSSGTQVQAEVERFCKYSEEVVRHLVTLAVVGKSAGNPALDREREERQARMAAAAAASRGYDRRPRRTEEAPAAAVAAPAEGVPAEAAPAMEAVPAEAASAAPVEGAPSA